MKNHSKIIIKLLVLACVVAGVCAGCTRKTGGDQAADMAAETQITATSSPAAEKEAVAAVFKNSETSEKTDRLKNDYIVIFQQYNASDWMQANIDGTEIQPVEIDEKYFDVAWLTNDWIYYVSRDEKVEMDATKYTIGRVPFHGQTRPMYDTKNKETLVEENNFVYVYDIMVTDSYLLYYTRDEKTDSSRCNRYDFATKEVSAAFTIKEGYYEIADNNSDLPLTIGDDFFISVENGVYSVSLETLEKKQIFFDKDEDLDDQCWMAEDGGVLYFMSKHSGNLYQYDGQESICVLAGKKFQKKMNTMHLYDDNASNVEIKITDITAENHRLYAAVSIEWNSKEKFVEGPHKGDVIENQRSRDVLISADTDNLGKWKLEDTLAEFIFNHSKRNSTAPDNCGWGNDTHRGKYETDAENTLDVSANIGFIYGSQVGFRAGDYDAYYLYDISTDKFEQIDETSYYIIDFLAN